MNKIIVMIFCFAFILFSCESNEKKNLKRLANNILTSKFKIIDSIFEENRPITSFYLDSIIKNKPSIYYQSSKDFFNKEYVLYLDGSNYSNKSQEYLFDYRCKTEDKFVKFTFTKTGKVWILKDMVLFDPRDNIH
jgi:hypothetical protein